MAKKNQSKPAAQAPAPAQPPAGEESKGLLARAVEAIDHVIHPDAAPKSEPDLVQSGVDPAVPAADQTVVSEVQASESKPASSYREHMAQWPEKKERSKKPKHCPTEQADLQKHPKFDKFKKESV